jgi:hypothetical protein
MKAKLSPMIKTFTPGLTELGKIKIGYKGETRKSEKGTNYQLPMKSDHFIVTGLERDNTNNFLRDEAIHKIIGDKPKRIPITLLFDDIFLNFQSRYACYQGTRLFCTGDGEQANRQGQDEPIQCPCERSEPDYTPTKDRCKMNGVLSVIIRGTDTIGGVWKFRTTSYNTIQGITSSLYLIKRITGGPLSGLDLDLVLAPKTANAPDGTSQKIYVVGIEYTGGMEQLRDEGLRLVQATSSHRKQLAVLEERAVQMIDVELEEENAEDTVAEWYPENDPNYVEPEKAVINLNDDEEVNTETGEVTEKPAKNKTKKQDEPEQKQNEIEDTEDQYYEKEEPEAEEPDIMDLF